MCIKIDIKSIEMKILHMFFHLWIKCYTDFVLETFSSTTEAGCLREDS